MRSLVVARADVHGRICLDVGQSTGGFTDVLLPRRGAGRGRRRGPRAVASGLEADARVVAIEGVNARELNAQALAMEPARSTCWCATSFISVTKLVHAWPASLAPGGQVVSLVKPQFEAGPQHVGRAALCATTRCWPQSSTTCASPSRPRLRVQGYFPSSIPGGDGNREFFIHANSSIARASTSLPDSGLPISLEFFLPKTEEGVGKLCRRASRVVRGKPEFCSVTYGAGRSDAGWVPCRPYSPSCPKRRSTALQLHRRANSATHPREAVQGRGYRPPRVACMRGDLPSGYGGFGEFRYASELVAFVREETGDYFRIEVAAYPEMHPQARSPEADLKASPPRCVRGATPGDHAKMIFNADAYFRLSTKRAARA